MVLGIIGKVGSGKSACVRLIEKEYNAIVLSCDEIAKDIIDRKETDYVPLPQIQFFESPEAQEECRKKVHKLVFDKISNIIGNFEEINNEFHKNSNIKDNVNFNQFLNKNNFNNLPNEKCGNIIVIECALPGEKLFNMCDKVICIENSYEDKIKLLNEKRAYSEETTKLILNSQKYYDRFYEKADYIIKNNGTKEDLEKKIKEVVDEICVICK